MNLAAQPIMTLYVTVSGPILVGETGRGKLAIIPITGGHFEGSGFRGKVCPGGADWNTRISAQLHHVLARYWLETDDGHFIAVENEGFVDNTKPDAIIKTTPRFLTDGNGKYAFLMKGTYVGELAGAGENAVRISVYRLE